jgi:hypothetical protein
MHAERHAGASMVFENDFVLSRLAEAAGGVTWEAS